MLDLLIGAIVKGLFQAEQKYVVRGATLKCSLGTDPGVLNLPKSHGVYIKKKPVMTVADCTPDNIGCFGFCQAKMGGVLDHIAGWSRTTSNSLAVQSNPLLKGILEFGADQLNAITAPHTVCTPGICGKWSSGKEDLLINNEQALLSKSTLTCSLGGTITIEHDGQD
ncbi:DUF4280 domain-containing protein [Paenibacillus elgii]|uniref:DUF4280 domain-containing protein n=1 Tax=Paenibacillus elgii TaxID=189691 RepID=UPI000248BFE0|nr:DUF4280 domain-containing protein [Paenibacillus elgii]